MVMKHKRLGDLLLEAGLITSEQLAHALAEQKKTGERLGEILVGQGLITEQELLEMFELQLGIPRVELDRFSIDPDALELVPEDVARRYRVLPIRLEENRLTVAMADPVDFFIIDHLAMFTKKQIEPVLAGKRELARAIDRCYGLEESVAEVLRNVQPEEIDLQEVSADDAPVVRLVNQLIEQAADQRASDIHFDPQQNELVVRFRIDGVLHTKMRFPKHLRPILTARLKIMANLDIAERRLPQDGRIQMAVRARAIDIRVAVLPTIFGEKVVLRLLDPQQTLTRLEILGFSETNYDAFVRMIEAANGMVLVTGPTGSGKTTTLAAMVDEINRTMAKHVITLEDPIEYLHSHRKSIVDQREIGLDTASFAAGLHAALREDPDIIGVALLGRVRQKDFVPFCRQFAALVRSGVPLVQTLALLAEQTGNKRLRQALLQVSALVQEGESLQDAFGQQRLFPEMFVRLLGVGEFSGQLPVVLERLADFYEKEQRLRQKVVSAFVYPATVLLAAVVVSLYLLVSVVPTFVQAFEQQGIPLPLPTRITVAVSQFLLDFWYLLLLLTVLLGVMGAYLRRTPQGKQWFGRLRLAVPIFGALEKKNILARFARTLALLVSSAVPILEALRLVGKSLGNDLYRRSLDEAVQGLSEGERIYATLERKRKLFPLMVTQMIAIGEEAGKLDFMLDKLADFYEQEVQTMTSRLHALMEPVLIMILAVVVGGIIVSVYMPMFIMMDAIGQ